MKTRIAIRADRQGERGSALLVVLVFAAMVAIFLYKEVPVVVTEAQRAREQILVDRGMQYQRAIQLYYRKMGRYPPTIDALENSNNIRFLRRRYKDPLTGEDNWRLLHMGPAGPIDSLVKPLNSNGNGQPFGQNATNQDGFGPSGFGQSSGQNGFGQSNSSQSGFGQGGFGQSNSSQSGFGQGGFGQSNSGQSGFGQSSFGQSNSRQSGFGQNNSSQSGFGQSSSGQNGFGQNGSQSGQQAGLSPDSQSGQQPDQNSGPAPIRRAAAVSASSNGETGGTVEGQTDPYGMTSNLQPALPGSTNSPGGNGLAPGQSPNQAGAPGTGPNGQPGTDPNSSIANQILRTPSPTTASGSMNANAFSAGNLAGVASKGKGHSIKAVNDQRDYSKWEFVYDFRKDATAGQASAMAAMNGGANNSATNPNSFGQTQSSFGQTQSGFGQTQSSFGQTQQSSAPPSSVSPNQAPTVNQTPAPNQ